MTYLVLVTSEFILTQVHGAPNGKNKCNCQGNKQSVSHEATPHIKKIP